MKKRVLTPRKILRVSWTAKKTNEWVLNKAGVKRELLDTDKARKLAYYGHTMRKPGSCLEKEVIFPRNPQNHVRWDTALPSHRLRPNRTSGSIDPPLPPPATTPHRDTTGIKRIPRNETQSKQDRWIRHCHTRHKKCIVEDHWILYYSQYLSDWHNNFW